MKPLLTRIDEELAVCADPYRRAELLGERGCYLARIGDFASARQHLLEIRSSLEVSTRERVAVRVMLLEGLLFFFDGLSVQCRDRVLRAHAIGHLSGQGDLARLTAAWLAHIDFNLNRFDDAARMIQYALRAPSEIADAATFRARLVLADLSMLSGRVEAAKQLYDLARRGAVEGGDDSTIAAIFFNRATMLLNQSRIGAILGEGSAVSQRFLELEFRSIELYHRASGQTSLPHLLDLLSAMILLEAGNFREAAEKYRRVLNAGPALTIGADDAIPALELALCLISLNELDEAKGIIEAIERMPKVARPLDDLLIIAGLKHRIGATHGVLINIDDQCDALQSSIQKFREQQAELRRMVDDIKIDF